MPQSDQLAQTDSPKSGEARLLFHPDGAAPAVDQVFVFGSNRAGRHGAGAARAAWRHYGARYGQGEGRQGRSYAIPTKDEQFKVLRLAQIRLGVERFIEHARHRPDESFFLTCVGCELAGCRHEDVAPLFAAAADLSNIDWPLPWRPWSAGGLAAEVLAQRAIQSVGRTLVESAVRRARE